LLHLTLPKGRNYQILHIKLSHLFSLSKAL